MLHVSPREAEPSLALVRGAEVVCSQHLPLRIEPERGQGTKHFFDGRGEPAAVGVSPRSKDGADVLQEDEGRSNVANHPGDVGPQPPLIVSSLPSSGVGEGLAGEARRDKVHRSAPRASIEGGQVVPHRRLIQGLVLHPRHEGGRCIGVPLDCTHKAVGVSEGEAQPEFESTAAGAEGKTSGGTCSHINRYQAFGNSPGQRWFLASRAGCHHFGQNGHACSPSSFRSTTVWACLSRWAVRSRSSSTTRSRRASTTSAK